MSRAKTVRGGTRVSIAAPNAKSANVAGAFNRWDPREHPPQRDRRGQWVGVLDLGPGEHQYKFVVDGRWCCADGRDGPYDGSPGHLRNEFGTMNIGMRVIPGRLTERRRLRPDGGPRAALHTEMELALNAEAQNGEPSLMTGAPRQPGIA